MGDSGGCCDIALLEAAMSCIVRLTLVALVVLLSSAMVHAADVPHPELAEADIDTLQRGMRDGTLSSEALTRAYLDRIAALDDRYRVEEP